MRVARSAGSSLASAGWDAWRSWRPLRSSARACRRPRRRGHPSRPRLPLIDRALEAGAIGDARANLLRVYALTNDSRLPAAYESDTPWRGTALAQQVERELPGLEPGPERRAIEAALRAPPADPNPARCFNLGGTQSHTSDHFYIQYLPGTPTGGLTIQDYGDSLDDAWDAEVTTFGWAAPPIDSILEGKYHVVVSPLGPALYGLVTTNGTYAGDSGDNPNTSWNDTDAETTCMVLNADFSAFPGTPQAAMDATTAHEFNHSLQYGYGALSGANEPDIAFPEGGATWMEDEVFRTPPTTTTTTSTRTSRRSMGEHAGNEYAYWLTFRGLTERFGTGTAGAGEQVMQDFWERISRFQAARLAHRARPGPAQQGLEPAGGLPRLRDRGQAHAHVRGADRAAVLLRGGVRLRGRGGREPDSQQAIAAVGGSAGGTVEDNYALNWVDLPIGSYNLTLSKPAAGGALRATVVCETATQLLGVRLAAPITGTGSATVPGLNTAGCTAATLVITNESQTGGDPTSSAARAYNVTTAAAPVSTNPTALSATPVSGLPPSTNPGGTPTPGSQSTAAALDAAGPVLSLLSLSRRRFRAFGSGPGISVLRGTRLRYRLSERAKVRVRLQRRNRAGRWITVRGSAVDGGVKGVNSFRFSGRWKRKRLVPATYRLRLQAKDGSGNLSSMRTTRALQIVRR